MRHLSVGKNLTAGSSNLMYTVPEGYTAQWNLLYLHNASGSTKTITVSWYDKSENTTINVFDAFSVASKDYFKMDGGAYVVLEAGDTISITPESGSTYYAICTFVLERI
jgi:hypothetical protein